MEKTAIMICHYSPQPKYWGMLRYHTWGKRLIKEGYDTYIVCSSVIHDSNINVIKGSKKYIIVEDDGIKYVYVNTNSYQDNGISRIKNLISFYIGAKSVLSKLPQADIIVAESPNPLDCVAAIQYSKKHGIPCVSDIVDLWPESIAVYKNMKQSNLLLKLLYCGEKWIYQNSTSIIFSMAGGYQYIVERGWKKIIPQQKVYYINTGVNVKEFDENISKDPYNDPALTDTSIFKVAYTGSVRMVNNLKMLCDAGKIILSLGYKDIFIMIHGSGDQVDELREYCKKNNIINVRLYGRIEKQQIPYVLNHSDVCILCYQNTPLLRFGGSMNKMFEYFASGRPIITNAKMGFSIIDEYKCGTELDTNDPQELAEAIISYYKMTIAERNQYGKNSRKAAEDYDINIICDKFMKVIRASEKRRKK